MTRRRKQPPPTPLPLEPRTAAEWRDVATLAEVLLRVDAARQYGLIVGGPTINVARCATLLKRAQRRGIVVLASELDAAITAFVRAHCLADAGPELKEKRR